MTYDGVEMAKRLAARTNKSLYEAVEMVETIQAGNVYADTQNDNTDLLAKKLYEAILLVQSLQAVNILNGKVPSDLQKVLFKLDEMKDILV